MFLKPPIQIYTPPVKLLDGANNHQTTPQKDPNTPGAGAGSPGKPGGSGGGQNTPGKPDNGGLNWLIDGGVPYIPSFESLFSDMLQHYLPELVTFEPVEEDVLRETIQNWLRPAYEQAINNRRERTQQQNAELDADAWARGLGASTYVSDVKERSFDSEARDVSDIESDYASTLSGQLYDALREQQEKKIAVDQFNAEQQNEARRRAADAAWQMYHAILDAAAESAQNAANDSAGTGGSGGSGGSGGDGGKDPSGSFLEALLDGLPTANQTDPAAYRSVVNLLSRLTPAQRKMLYEGKGEYAQQNADILKSIGYAAYEALKQKFPA